ncbi:TPA: hypothetical protein EYO57_27325 [Candidatus Poribacteria bacterium]|nr:hypothetical protein [Candidatus Poribacteria bacterium]
MVGKNKASIELYKKRVLEYPDDPDEYLLLIKVYLYADQVEEAKKAIDAVKKICDDEIKYICVAGDIYARLGETEKALECWEKSVIDQFSMSGLYSRAFMFKNLGRLEEAITEWRRIVNMLEKHHDPTYAIWPKEELAKLEAQLN